MPVNMTNIVYSGPYYPMVTEEGNTAFGGVPNSPRAVEILSDYSLKGLADKSKNIIEILDLNRIDEVQFRKNATEISNTADSSNTAELNLVIKRFCSGIYGIAGLNRASSSLHSIQNQEVLDRLLYANVITTLETFLSDYLITAVKINEDVFKSLVRNHTELSKRKLTLNELIVMDVSPSSTVIQTLEKVTFHNLKVAKIYYEAAFGIEFEQPEAVISAVDLRHDIVHRGGVRLGEEHPVRIHPRITHKLILDVQTLLISLLNKVQD